MIGSIHILTIKGDEIGQINWHDGKINNIVLSADERLALSCSDDGRIAVIDTFDCKSTANHLIFNENITSCDISPNYRLDNSYLVTTTNPDQPLSICKKSSYSFWDSSKVSAEKVASWLSGGQVNCVRWEKGGRYIAWASPEGVSVIDGVSRNLVTLLPPHKSLSKSSVQLFPCHIFWITSEELVSELVVAWGSSVQLLSLKKVEVDVSNEAGESVGKEWDTNIKVTSSFEVGKNYAIAGIACHKETDVILLVLSTIEGMPPSILICDWSGVIDKSAHLPVNGPVSFGELCMSYCVYSNFTSICHIVCGNSVYLMEIRDADDEIGFLLAHSRFKEALQQAKVWSDANFLRTYTYEAVAQTYLDYLLNTRDRERFVKVLMKAGKVKPDLWRVYTDKLAELKLLQLIVDYIPVRKPRFDRKFYDKILRYLLAFDTTLFVQVVHKWPAKIFHAAEMLKKVDKDLKAKDLPPEKIKSLSEARTALLIACGKLDAALQGYDKITADLMKGVLKPH
eukprot:TRINITY_DN244_c0_g1_i3.p1 TRINITY_DN244_c0_g1~~TRINITY_DN244_c0_g1_i3.p1  ORF type:complete len:510 (-),score=114.12 TRINITY_DN244_c0_g1_i3:2789-4318(-)